MPAKNCSMDRSETSKKFSGRILSKRFSLTFCLGSIRFLPRRSPAITKSKQREVEGRQSNQAGLPVRLYGALGVSFTYGHG
jgi:hypothetical protein